MPKRVQDTVESTQFLELLMGKAQTHWCCVGFKVAPITSEVIKYWRRAPITVVYCVASIVLVTFMDHQAGQSFVKQTAMEFYQQARRSMDNLIFEDDDDDDDDDDDQDALAVGNFDALSPAKRMTIQSYFCLSYTSNLLRLYEQQRSWGGLASIALQLRTKDALSGCRPLDLPVLRCWARWYYVDAWMSLTLHRDCLLPDMPPADLNLAVLQDADHISLYRFANMATFMRRYISAMRGDQLLNHESAKPTAIYYSITRDLDEWYEKTGNTSDKDNHLHLCYHAMRLVVLYQFLPPEHPPKDEMILQDALQTNLSLLDALQSLSSKGCDQSTYHHMFFAIHNTASRIYTYFHKMRTNNSYYNANTSKWRRISKDQLPMNFVLLKRSQAYVNDVFKMRFYAENIERQFEQLGIKVPPRLQQPDAIPIFQLITCGDTVDASDIVDAMDTVDASDTVDSNDAEEETAPVAKKRKKRKGIMDKLMQLPEVRIYRLKSTLKRKHKKTYKVSKH
ncbi:hypothetical protein BC940DRAFT_234804 [Gongronella butleri]|nr:hypothetical protein BC940DRAFT_234804 [Gongronella butleri]